MHFYSMFTACLQHVHCMFIACLLHANCDHESTNSRKGHKASTQFRGDTFITIHETSSCEFDRTHIQDGDWGTR